MSRTLHALRASLAAGAFLMACGSQAADVAVQRVAMACTQSSDAAACKGAATPSARHTAAVQRTEMAVAKAPARRTQETRAVAHHDGSRFTYDSCGCSN